MSGWTYDWLGPLVLPWVDGWFGPEPAPITPGQPKYLSTQLTGQVPYSFVSGEPPYSTLTGSTYESHLEQQ